MRILRIGFSIIVLFVAVCALALGCFVYFIDLSKLKPILAEEVKKQTGYILVMDGKISWSFFPTLGVKIDHLALRAPNQTNIFMDLNGVRLATEIMELLQGRQTLKGDVHIDDVRLAKVHAQDVSADLDWADKVLTIKSIRADLYDGSLAGVVHAKDFATTPRWEFNLKLNGIQLQPLLTDVNGADSKVTITGTGNVKLQAITQGNTSAQLLNNMNGVAAFDLDNGLVKGVDLNYLVQSADALLNKQPVTAPTTPNQTAFNSLTGTIKMDAGNATTQDLQLVSPALLTNGSGSITLDSRALNFHLAVKPQQTLKTKWEVPVLVTGTIDSPNVRLDMMEIEKGVAKQQLDKLKVKANDLIKEHVPGKAGEVLQNLIGN